MPCAAYMNHRERTCSVSVNPPSCYIVSVQWYVLNLLQLGSSKNPQVSVSLLDKLQKTDIASFSNL